MCKPQYYCPCCGYRTLTAQRHNEICEKCFWEDDPVQNDDPHWAGGANKFSLQQSQQNFLQFGAAEMGLMHHVREPNRWDKRDPNWKPLEGNAA